MISRNRLMSAIATATFSLATLLLAGTNVLHAQTVEHRAVNKKIKDLPEQNDPSTPEAVVAACARNLAKKDVKAILDLSWIKVDEATVKNLETSLNSETADQKDYSDKVLDTEIIEVLQDGEDFAAVISKSNLSGKDLYGIGLLGRINGTWKSLDWAEGMSLDTSNSVEEAEKRFAEGKDSLRQKYEKIKKAILDGQTVMMSAKQEENPADAKKSEETGKKPEENAEKQKTDEDQAESATDESASKEDSKPAPNLSPEEEKDVENWKKETWQVIIKLDMPDLKPQAVQFTLFDKDPVPAFVAQTKKMKAYSQEQLAKADNDARKDQLSATQMKVWWDSGFKEVTGDNLWLLTAAPDSVDATHSISSNEPGGKKWLVTKMVDLDGSPVCWCVPVEVKTGEQIEIVLNKDNLFDLKSVFDKAMTEPINPDNLDSVKKMVEETIAKNSPEITSREAMEWGAVEKGENGQWSIRFKYLAKFQDKESKIMNQIFTFDADGKLSSAKDVEGFPKNW